MRFVQVILKGWATAAGNYTTYLLDYGRYEEVLTYSDSVLAICRQVDGGINPVKHMQCVQRHCRSWVRILAAVDTLITRALELIDRTIPDIDKKNIYFRALNLNAWINRALARCIQFAQAKEFWSLRRKQREMDGLRFVGRDFRNGIEGEVLANKRALAAVDEGQSKFLAFELARGRLKYEDTNVSQSCGKLP